MTYPTWPISLLGFVCHLLERPRLRGIPEQLHDLISRAKGSSLAHGQNAMIYGPQHTCGYLDGHSPQTNQTYDLHTYDSVS